jgi:RHS repeat-associated protein
MLTAAKEETFSAPMVWTDECVLPLAASAVYPKTRVWGSKPENVHCSSATSPLKIELHWGCEESSEKTAVGSGVTYDYDAFGNLIHSTGTTPNNYLFAGEQFDPDLNLYYNRARYLNVPTSRFWTQDPSKPDIRLPHTLHRYLFAANDPINRHDPSGNDDIGELSVSESISETLDTLPSVQAGPAEDLASEAVQAETDTAFENSLTWREAEEDTLKEIGGRAQEPFNTSSGPRIVDAYNPETEVAAESKSGFVQYSERIITQIEKDAELLRNPNVPIKEYIWRFYRSPYTGRIGADPRVLQLLEDNGIKWILN